MSDVRYATTKPYPLPGGFGLMSRGAHNFKQGDITKAIKGAVNAGFSVKRVEIEGGKIIVFAGRPDNKQDAAANEWDDVQ